jgi:hypothetical protein
MNFYSNQRSIYGADAQVTNYSVHAQPINTFLAGDNSLDVLDDIVTTIPIKKVMGP